jgi:hypothetical protein
MRAISSLKKSSSDHLREVVAGLGGLAEGEALGVEIGHVTACFGLAGDRK